MIARASAESPFKCGVMVGAKLYLAVRAKVALAPSDVSTSTLLL
jgi:hypothetical protein